MFAVVYSCASEHECVKVCGTEYVCQNAAGKEMLSIQKEDDGNRYD